MIHSMSASPSDYRRRPEVNGSQDKHCHEQIPVVVIVTPEHRGFTLQIDFVHVDEAECVHRCISQIVLNWDPVSIVAVSSFVE